MSEKPTQAEILDGMIERLRKLVADLSRERKQVKFVMRGESGPGGSLMPNSIRLERDERVFCE